MWLSGMNRPDFRTINRFRSGRLADGRFESVFHQVVGLLHDEGLISLDVQYIDGNKIESVANKYTFVWKGSVEKNKAKLLANVDGVLKEAEEILAEENASVQPEEITKEDLQRRTDRILEKMDKEGVADKKLRKAVTKPGYNVQIATENQYIVNYDLYWRSTDYGTLIPLLQSFPSGEHVLQRGAGLLRMPNGTAHGACHRQKDRVRSRICIPYIRVQGCRLLKVPVARDVLQWQV